MLSSFFFCEALSMTSRVMRITSMINPNSVRMTISRFSISDRSIRYPSLRLQGLGRLGSKKVLLPQATGSFHVQEEAVLRDGKA